MLEPETESVLKTLTPAQRLAVYDWLADEADYDDMRPSWLWSRTWMEGVRVR